MGGSKLLGPAAARGLQLCGMVACILPLGIPQLLLGETCLLQPCRAPIQSAACLSRCWQTLLRASGNVPMQQPTCCCCCLPAPWSKLADTGL